MMCFGVGLFVSILLRTLCASQTCISTSFTKLGKFSFIIFPNRFPISCSFFSPSGTSMMQMLECLKLSQRLLTLSLLLLLLFGFFFLLVLIGCFLLPYVPNHWFEWQLPPPHCWFLVDFSLFHLVCLNFFMQSSIDGHLGCFRILAIINNAAMNIWMHVSWDALVKKRSRGC